MYIIHIIQRRVHFSEQWNLLCVHYEIYCMYNIKYIGHSECICCYDIYRSTPWLKIFFVITKKKHILIYYYNKNFNLPRKETTFPILKKSNMKQLINVTLVYLVYNLNNKRTNFILQ